MLAPIRYATLYLLMKYIIYDELFLMICIQVFTPTEEEALQDYMLHSSDIYFGLTSTDARSLAFSFARELKKSVPASWNANETAGIDWFRGFMSRHPKLSLCTPEATSLARASAFNRPNVELFFNNLDGVIENMTYKPQNIWNIDETGVQTVHEPKKSSKS